MRNHFHDERARFHNRKRTDGLYDAWIHNGGIIDYFPKWEDVGGDRQDWYPAGYRRCAFSVASVLVQGPTALEHPYPAGAQRQRGATKRSCQLLQSFHLERRDPARWSGFSARVRSDADQCSCRRGPGRSPESSGDAVSSHRGPQRYVRRNRKYRGYWRDLNVSSAYHGPSPILGDGVRDRVDICLQVRRSSSCELPILGSVSNVCVVPV